ncbi:MAG: DUF1211 domain-containing protein [Cytophagaceae bacterium]|nr:MAG: DUF1211 domain-containing protein [Cytophagaceae bacterium]
MGKIDNASNERKTNRLEAFSDAVLAIAITLPVVELQSPTVKAGGNLAAAYAALWPEYVSYALSCIVIGLYWVHSHFSGKIFKKTNHGFNLLTMLFLALVSITPFPTRPFIEHLSDTANNRVAATVYSALLAAPAMVWFVRWQYAISQELLDPHLAASYLRRLTLKYAFTAVAAAAAPVICWFVDWRLGIGLTAITILRYLMPPMTPQFKPGEEPADELQEADDE